jgi:hypothetical protein
MNKSEKIIEAARELFSSFGYHVGNLWHVDDIHFLCEQNAWPKISDVEAKEVFSIASEQFDGDAGLSWPKLEEALMLYYKRNAISAAPLTLTEIQPLRDMMIGMKPIIPHSTLDDALAQAARAFSRELPEAQQNLSFVQRLQSNDELRSLIADDLAACHLDHIYYLGHGRSGTCLEARTRTNDEVAVMLRKFIPIRRAPIPQQLQSLKTFNHGRLSVEILPKLSAKHVDEQALQNLCDAIRVQTDARGRHYEITDVATRNAGFGTDNKTAFYLDADAVNPKKLSGDTACQPPHNAWVAEDGTWTQYNMYKRLHCEFDSPLHQHEGKGVPMAALASAPVDGSKTGPLRF